VGVELSSNTSLTPSHTLCSQGFIGFLLKFGFKKPLSLSHFFAARILTHLEEQIPGEDFIWFR
jgi:hypothetical protein